MTNVFDSKQPTGKVKCPVKVKQYHFVVVLAGIGVLIGVLMDQLTAVKFIYRFDSVVHMHLFVYVIDMLADRLLADE
jgi:hypothetical protein